MKNNARIFIYPLFLGVLLMFAISCNKDDTTSSSSKKDPVITWANPADISFGTLLGATQLNAIADVPGSFYYIPAAGTKLKVGANQDLKVEFTPTDAATYNTVSKTVKINVYGNIDPVITWANPDDISFGTLLSATQLNAIANVPGSFYYTPAAGTKLNVGANQDLKVEFTPTDVTTYNTVSKTVKINVIASSGNGIIFNPNLTYGTVTDIDGNVYKTITIGLQTWMAENLRTTRYRNGDSILEATDDLAWYSFTFTTGVYCNYDNTSNSDSIATYGRLYNWYAVNDSRKLAPAGWHVASNDEWKTLTERLGGDDIACGKLKETGTTHWYVTNETATNESGFTALPGGYRNSGNGSFNYIGDYSYWWSSTEDDTNSAWRWYLSDSVYPFLQFKTNCFSVRCVRDL